MCLNKKIVIPKYLIKANFYDDFFIYKDEELIMTAKRKYIWFAGIRVSVFFQHDENLKFTYRYFSFFWTMIKISYQNLPKKIISPKASWRGLCFRVNDHNIYCKFNSLPQKKMGKIEIDNIEVAKITNKKVFGSDLEFEIIFNKKNELETYCILSFLMNVSLIESL